MNKMRLSPCAVQKFLDGYHAQNNYRRCEMESAFRRCFICLVPAGPLR